MDGNRVRRTGPEGPRWGAGNSGPGGDVNSTQQIEGTLSDTKRRGTSWCTYRRERIDRRQNKVGRGEGFVTSLQWLLTTCYRVYSLDFSEVPWRRWRRSKRLFEGRELGAL